jgi:hypothetical protein
MSSIKYRPEIDGLRACAVIPVILFHMGLDWIPGGFVGVDVFFVISGFLIASIVIKELESGNFFVPQFLGPTHSQNSAGAACCDCQFAGIRLVLCLSGRYRADREAIFDGSVFSG